RRWAGGTDENGTVRDSSLCGRWGDGTAETRHPRIVDNLTIAEPGAATATPAPIPAAHRRAADTPVHDRLPIVDNPPGGSLAFQPPGGAPPRPAPPIRSRLRDHRNPAPAQRSPLGAAPRRAARRRTAARPRADRRPPGARRGRLRHRRHPRRRPARRPRAAGVGPVHRGAHRRLAQGRRAGVGARRHHRGGQPDVHRPGGERHGGHQLARRLRPPDRRDRAGLRHLLRQRPAHHPRPAARAHLEVAGDRAGRRAARAGHRHRRDRPGHRPDAVGRRDDRGGPGPHPAHRRPGLRHRGGGLAGGARRRPARGAAPRRLRGRRRPAHPGHPRADRGRGAGSDAPDRPADQRRPRPHRGRGGPGPRAALGGHRRRRSGRVRRRAAATGLPAVVDAAGHRLAAHVRRRRGVEGRAGPALPGRARPLPGGRAAAQRRGQAAGVPRRALSPAPRAVTRREVAPMTIGSERDSAAAVPAQGGPVSPAEMPATELLARYASGALSPVEAVESVLARIERENPALNAFCQAGADEARAAAKASAERWRRGEPGGPPAGVPAAITDVILTRGRPTLRGSATADPDQEWPEDSPVVARLREAGSVFTGKTTTPEIAWKGVTDSPLTGVTRNPWDLSATPGGSSGGASAAVAAGLGPLATGTDGGGSVRIPASFTGVFALKPTWGLVPHYPASAFGSLAHSGPITRTVADAALMMDVITGPDPRDWGALAPPSASFSAALGGRGVRGMRIAYSPALWGLEVDPEVAAAVETAVAAFTELGAE